MGKIRSIDLIKIEGAERNKGKGILTPSYILVLIEFYNTISANKAKQALNAKSIEGKILIANNYNKN